MQTSKQSRPRRKPRAATGDILAGAAHQQKIAPKWRNHFERLTELREHLLHRRLDLNKDALEEQPAFSTHMADAGTDHYDRDIALGLLSSEQDAVYEVEHALDRIRSGTYGLCELT